MDKYTQSKLKDVKALVIDLVFASNELWDAFDDNTKLEEIAGELMDEVEHLTDKIADLELLINNKL